MRGSSLWVLCENEWIFDGGRPAFLAVLWHSPHLFIVGAATLPPCPAPAWHWQQLGCDGCPIDAPPLMTVWHVVQSVPFFGSMCERCENSAFRGVTWRVSSRSG